MVRYFVDTNVIWWYIVRTSKHHESVKTFLDPIILKEDSKFIVNSFVMIELFHLLVKQKGKQGHDIASYLIDGNHSFFEVKHDLVHDRDLRDVLDILIRHGTTTTIGGRDSSILHSMKKHGIACIITGDKGFENVPGIHVLNPLS